MKKLFALSVVALALVGCNPFEPDDVSLAKSWCTNQHGEWLDGFSYAGERFPNTCRVPTIKGKAGIVVDHIRYEFESTVVNYDTGDTELAAVEYGYLRSRSWQRLLDNGTVKKSQLDEKRFKVGNYITKGVYN